ncbi:hypothetical protein [Citreimonas salinaria]|uniref:Mu-like prophage FluMu N-terminal domain-containing protein n=1 Tax=Citreimonas salinaria TaxID=321339 RepID=A0A1H3KUC8_9RHOB|nr:hypothetical protein [Citreimonas salinaria]SDY55358.1 hypothetical protein SAMN05444340_11096 [Citreimonas salinaria]
MARKASPKKAGAKAPAATDQADAKATGIEVPVASAHPDGRATAAEAEIAAGQTVAPGPAREPAATEQAGATAPAAEAEPAAVVQGTAAGGAGETGGGAAASRTPIPTKAKPLVVVVKGPKRGRWRAGRHFGAQPVTIPLEELTEGEKAALIADPRLSVETREAD